jgi:type III pantothenate kinase
VAVIGAHDLAGARDALVVSIGTALTVDVVSGEGRHLGGAIVPGPRTMVGSLLSGTHGIRRRARGAHASGGSSRRLFAADTASALQAGAAFAAAAFIDRAANEAAALFGRRPLLLLTGGAARESATYIKSAVRAVPDLVLRGLAVLARG